MNTFIFASYKDFLNREDKDANGVSLTFAEEYPNWEEMNQTNKGCWNCADCTDCLNCVSCYGCHDVRDSAWCVDSAHSTDSEHLNNCVFCVKCEDLVDAIGYMNNELYED